jgi:uncharacterized membrane protein
VRSTVDLVHDLVRQGRELLRIEVLLARTEFAERGNSALLGLTVVGFGLALLGIGLGLIFVALSLFIARFGVPLDLAFLVVALVTMTAGLLAVLSGARNLQPSRLLPEKSISQISSLMGGEPWA